MIRGACFTFCLFSQKVHDDFGQLLFFCAAGEADGAAAEPGQRLRRAAARLLRETVNERGAGDGVLLAEGGEHRVAELERARGRDDDGREALPCRAAAMIVLTISSYSAIVEG